MFATLRFRTACVLFMAAALLCRPADCSSAAAVYLQSTSDRYQSTVDVYTIADGAGNHFAARGEFDSLSADVLPAMDEISPTISTAFGAPSEIGWVQASS